MGIDKSKITRIDNPKIGSNPSTSLNYGDNNETKHNELNTENNSLETDLASSIQRQKNGVYAKV